MRGQHQGQTMWNRPPMGPQRQVHPRLRRAADVALAKHGRVPKPVPRCGVQISAVIPRRTGLTSPRSCLTRKPVIHRCISPVHDTCVRRSGPMSRHDLISRPSHDQARLRRGQSPCLARSFWRKFCVSSRAARPFDDIKSALCRDTETFEPRGPISPAPGLAEIGACRGAVAGLSLHDHL